MTALIDVVVAGRGYLAVDRQQTIGNGMTFNVKVERHPASDQILFCASNAPLIAYPAQLVTPPTDKHGKVEAPDAGWVDRYWKRLLELGHPPLDRDGDLDGNLLVLTPGAVTLIGATGWPSHIGESGVALGYAGDFALGAFHGYREAHPEVSIETALTAAIGIASRLSHSSGGDVDVVSL